MPLEEAPWQLFPPKRLIVGDRLNALPGPSLERYEPSGRHIGSFRQLRRCCGKRRLIARRHAVTADDAVRLYREVGRAKARGR